MDGRLEAMFGGKIGKSVDDLEAALDKCGGRNIGVGMEKKERNGSAMGGETDIGILV
jgi:hypothetical protein